MDTRPDRAASAPRPRSRPLSSLSSDGTARMALRAANAELERLGCPLAYPSYGTPLFGAQFAPA